MKGDKSRKISGQPDTTRRREPDWETSKEKPVKIGIERPGNASGRHMYGNPDTYTVKREIQRVGHH